MPRAPLLESPADATQVVSARPSGTTVRRPEWVIYAFFLYSTVAACILPVAQSVKYRIGLIHLALILVYAWLVQRDSWKPMAALSVIRDWLPLGLVLLAYREMGWFALPHQGHTLEAHWVVWDRLVLGGGGKVFIEAFGPILPSLLEIAYAMVYTLAPFAVAVLYIYGQRDSVDRFLFVFLLGVLLCYVQFPFWPSDPPIPAFTIRGAACRALCWDCDLSNKMGA